MASTVRVLGSIWNTTAGTKSLAVTPAVGELLVVITGQSGVVSTTVSDNQSGAYTQIINNGTGAANYTVFVRNSFVTSAVSTTITSPQTSSTGGGLIVLAVTNVAAAGSAAVRSTASPAAQASTVTPAPVLNNTPLSTNPIIAGLINGTNGTANATPRTGYTEAADLGYNTPTTGIEVQYRNSGETSATLTFGGNSPSTFAAFAVELNSNAAPTVALNTADATSFSSATPTVQFTGTDAESNDISYEVQIDTINTFDSNQSPYNLTSAVSQPTTGTLTSGALSVYYGGAISSDGTKIFYIVNNATLYWTTLSTPWDITTASGTSTFDPAGTTLSKFSFLHDGSKLYVLAIDTDVVYQYSLSTPWDMSTATLTSTSPALFTGSVYGDVTVTPDGTKLYVGTLGSTDMYTMSTPFDLSTAVSAGSTFTPTAPTNSQSKSFSHDGMYWFITSNTGTLYKFALTTAWDLSTASTTAVQTLTLPGTSDTAFFGKSGTRLYSFDALNTNPPVTQWNLTGPTITKVSSSDTGFVNTVNGADTDPFTSGQAVNYSVQTSLTNGTYYWRVRGTDPSGSGSAGAWSTTRSFTVSVAGGSTTGQIKIYTGSAFVAKPVKVWNGSAWVTKPVKRWNGSSWVTTTY